MSFEVYKSDALYDKMTKDQKAAYDERVRIQREKLFRDADMADAEEEEARRK